MPQKTMPKVLRASAVSFGLLAMLLSGCGSTLGKAKQTAAVSQKVYASVEAETVKQIAAIIEKDRSGTITKDDKDRLVILNDLRKVLDKFADAHNAYVAGLKVWEDSKTKPTDLDDLSMKMLEIVKDAQDLAKRLGIRVR